jgi:Fic family protein
MTREERQAAESNLGQTLYTNESDKYEKGLRNALLLFCAIEELLDPPAKSLNLTPQVIKHLHYHIIKDIYSCAGQYRNRGVRIRGSKHTPPAPQYVEGLVQEMCDLANNNTEWKPIETAAYLLWRLNWIHPFGGGNGRTSRGVSYLALCTRLGFRLPGQLTIPEQLGKNRERYQAALEDADEAALVHSTTDFSRMTTLLSELLEVQLESDGRTSD